MNKSKVSLSSFKNEIESKYNNGVPVRVIEAWLLLNNVKISHTAILHHMKEHTTGKRNLSKPQSTEAAQFKNGIDPYESTEAHDERVLREKYVRDGASDAEIEEGAKQAVEDAKKAEEATKRTLAGIERVGAHVQESERYNAWKAAHEDTFKRMYEADKGVDSKQTKGGESVDA